MEEAVAVDIVETILGNLRGRKGMGNELEGIDAEVYNHMFETLVELTQGRLEAFSEKVEENVKDRLL